MANTTFMSVFVVFMLLVQLQGGQARLYMCWGGCLNECFLLGSKQIGQRFPCYVNCLAKCFYRPGFGTTPPGPDGPPPSAPAPALSPSDSLEADVETVADTRVEINESLMIKRNDCVIQCSLQTCGLYNDGENEYNLKKCLAGCIVKCKDL